jgi:hypothetical protein
MRSGRRQGYRKWKLRLRRAAVIPGPERSEGARNLPCLVSIDLGPFPRLS